MISKDYWTRIPLWGFWDNETPQNNPHKGWYLHYYDNGITRYFDPDSPDDYLLDFPCFNHIYLRLGWNYLEPEEGKYRWDILDDVIKRWWAHDRRVTFRISCKETDADQVYATPKWVMDAGAKGEMVETYGFECFEPDYGDPVFLEKFSNFMNALGERYDGAPFMEFIDVGSFGEWGECHTEGSSDRAWPIEVMKEHIDIHTRAFKKTPVIVNNDIVALRRTYDGTEEELQKYIAEEGCGMRTDGGCVGFYADRYGLSSIHMPHLFEDIWRNKPIDLEFAHYNHGNDKKSWNHGYTILAAVPEIHASYAGFHGYAREWYGNNEHYAGVLGNILGYWYFPQAVYLPRTIRAGERLSMGMTWENRGSALCYTKYKLYLKLHCKETGQTELLLLREADNRRWIANALRDEVYSIRPGKHLQPGTYAVSFGLFEELDENAPLPDGYTMPESQKFPFPGRAIKLGLRKEILNPDGFYGAGDIEITAPQDIYHEGVVKVPSLWPGHPKNQGCE